jgi:hypothetical protein
MFFGWSVVRGKKVCDDADNRASLNAKLEHGTESTHANWLTELHSTQALVIGGCQHKHELIFVVQ